MYSSAARGGEDFGENAPLTLSPLTLKTLEQISKFKNYWAMEVPINHENFMIIAHRTCGIYIPKFSFSVPHSNPCTDWSETPNFTH